MINLINRFKDMIVKERQSFVQSGGARKERLIKRRSVRLLAGFFAVMAVLTVLSRVADAMIVAKVTVALPERGALTYEIKAQGQIESSEELSIDAETNLRVTDVFVEAGQEVKAGDPLITFDTEEIGEQLYQAEGELDKLKLQKEQQGLGDTGSAVENAQIALGNARNDAKTKESSASRSVERAEQDYNDADDAYQEAKKNEDQLNKEQRQQAINTAQAALDAAQNGYDNALLTRDSALLVAQRAVEDAQDALSEAQDSGDADTIAAAQTALDRAMEDQNATIEYQGLMVEQAQGNLTSAQNDLIAAETGIYNAGTQLVKSTRSARENAERALQDAKDARDEQRTDSQRTIEAALQQLESARNEAADAGKQTDIQRQSINIDIELKEREVETLRELQSNNIVTAPSDGVILSVAVDIGDRTTGGEVVRMSARSGGYKFRAMISEEEAGHITSGDKIELTLNGEKVPIQGEIESIHINETEGTAEIMASLPERDYTEGISAAMEISIKSENYRQCVPIEAVRKDMSGTYILVIRESNSVLGKEYTVARAVVTVLDHDAATAAVKGAIAPEDKIVVSSNKPIDDGDRARMSEE